MARSGASGDLLGVNLWKMSVDKVRKWSSYLSEWIPESHTEEEILSSLVVLVSH